MPNKTVWSDIKSILFVPANQRRLKHIPDILADAFIIDLEDSIKEDAKEKARCELKEWLNSIETVSVESTLILRVNKEYIEEEAMLFATESRINCIAVPKVESYSDIEKVAKCFPNKDVLALVETPKGVLNLDSIIVHKSIKAVGFGGEDFCVAMGMIKRQEYLIPIKQHILMYCKSNGINSFDMVEAEYKDKERFGELAQVSRDLGFSGKMAIHPNQVQIINSVYDEFDKEKMLYIISEYERRDEGFVMIDGVIYEKPHIDRMRKLIDEK